MPDWSVEVLGYVAAALVLASCFVRSVVKLSTIALAGSLLFLAYSLLRWSGPVAVASAAAVVLTILSLRRERSKRRRITATEVEPDTPFLRDFLAANDEEIRRTQPDYEVTPADRFVRVLLRDGLPAGVVAGRQEGPELYVAVDYVTPAYQDSRIGRWLFGEGSEVFRANGIHRLVAVATTSGHRTYLQQMGFQAEGSLWVKTLD